MKGIYLCSGLAFHPQADLDYNDICLPKPCHLNRLKNDSQFYIGDCLSLCDDLSKYDYIIATPPCNYWLHANYRYCSSKYALDTKHLLPDLIEKLGSQKKPFIIENVINVPRMKVCGIFALADKYNLNVYFIGRHTYFTNIFLGYIPYQRYKEPDKFIQRLPVNQRQGVGVAPIIDAFIESVGMGYAI